METLAARVTPAVVNVTVVSKSNAQQGGMEGMPDMQQFFGPGILSDASSTFQCSLRTAWNTVWAAASSFLPMATS